MNTAIPVLTLSEPGPVQNYEIHEGLKVNVWDQWVFECEKNSTLNDLFEFIRKNYGIEPIDVFKGNKAVFFSTINKFEDYKEEKIVELLDMEEGENCFISVICKLKKEDKKSLDNLPLVKVVFKK